MEPKPQYAISEVVMCDADYDAEVRFAGAGVLRIDDGVDREYVYPPAKWDIKPVTTWPAEVDAKLTSIEARQNMTDERLSDLEALIHKAITGGRQ